MRKAQLFSLTGSEFEAFSHSDPKGRIICVPGENIPLVRWPNNSWCFEANAYIQRLYDQGKSRKGGGGTLKTYISQITHLIRYCFNNKIDFIDLSDNYFTLFIKSLCAERRADKTHELIRDANTVRAIGRICLDFLDFIGKLYQNEKFVAADGQISATRRKHVVQSDALSGRSVVQEYWHHRSFPTGDSKRKRLPISKKSIAQLRDAVLSTSGTTYKRKRRYVMILLLEITGARRFEISTLTVQSVLDALKMPTPMLKMITAKRKGGDKFREIPILQHDLNLLIEFVEKNRKGVIRKTCGFKNDDGVLLVNEKTGRGLMPNTITQELYFLRKHAGISEKACAHMFRHAFVTKLFKALIELHKVTNTDNLRQMLLDGESLKREIQQWTGHKSIESLETYIHLAFEDTASHRKAIDVVRLEHLLLSLKNNLATLKIDTRLLPKEKSLAAIEKFLDLAIADLREVS